MNQRINSQRLFALRALLAHNAFTLFTKKSGGNEMAETAVRPKPNGPYLIEGPVDIYDTAGNKIDTAGRPKIALCRCGASSNKPFCDGTHSKIGFQAAEAINPESAEPPPYPFNGGFATAHSGQPLACRQLAMSNGGQATHWSGASGRFGRAR